MNDEGESSCEADRRLNTAGFNGGGSFEFDESSMGAATFGGEQVMTPTSQ